MAGKAVDGMMLLFLNLVHCFIQPMASISKSEFDGQSVGGMKKKEVGMMAKKDASK